MTHDADRQLKRLQKRLEESEDISSDDLGRITQFVRLVDGGCWGASGSA
ncbi:MULTISPECIES: hypothetical protein [Natrinema]|uniref:Uncharacterized protein n=1 Tax=Natrinema gari JCM 14663 TaxID=1230459 RepID=L9YV02_9EURY|nr:MULTISPECIES: hypothetical protein [Natrinema]AFO59472.1 hypothetical protein NJ7G_4257 [Natrinema sp. J7-2]ELY77954.1 hypothetical protein C486_13822 [Natrinema gari JCM 14663]